MFEAQAVAGGVSDTRLAVETHAQTSVRRPAPPRVASGKLLGGSHELVIEHAGQEYRLRLTRNDKLILTK